MSMVRLEGVTRKYANATKPAVDHLSLTVEEGSVYGLLGPNGAGKSTTVLLLCGLLRPDEGKVEVLGLDAFHQGGEVRKRVGVAPQDIALFPVLTARENLHYFGRMYGLSLPVIRDQIEYFLDAFGLTDKADKRVQTFSGGMKRRLNLMAALLHDPPLILLDEPTTGVDVQSRNMILDYLVSLKQKGKTIIYSSHILEEAERLCTHVGIMDDGKLVTNGLLDEVMRAHSDCKGLEEVFLKLTGKHIRD